MVSPELVDPPVPELPIAPRSLCFPVHWLEAILTPVDEVTGDAGIVIIGPTPALSISVASSGTVPPREQRPGRCAGSEERQAMPVDETDAALQPLDDMPSVEGGASRALEVESGLKPRLISVAPSGMPVGAPDGVEPRAFSGDVAPSADLLGARA